MTLLLLAERINKVDGRRQAAVVCWCLCFTLACYLVWKNQFIQNFIPPNFSPGQRNFDALTAHVKVNQKNYKFQVVID